MKLKNVAIIGAGTMGHALGLVHALGGCNVRITDQNREALESAGERIAYAMETLVEAGIISREDAARTASRIECRASLAEACEAADLVVEAVIEQADVKGALFREIDLLAPTEAILASNTSALDIFPLIPERRLPFSVVAHWYTPPYIIDLVDLVRSPQTSAETFCEIKSLYEDFGKSVLVFDTLVPGYIANRLQAALNLECFRLIDEGIATAEQIDLSIKTGLAGRLAALGHMQKADFTGLETVRDILRSKSYRPPEVTGGSRTLDGLIERGRRGVVSGAGFYDYGETAPEKLFRARDIKLLKVKAALSKIEKEEVE